MVEEQAPFLAGHGKEAVDLSPIKIVKVCGLVEIIGFGSS